MQTAQHDYSMLSKQNETTMKKVQMDHKGRRITLAAIEGFTGLGAVGGGIAILTGAFNQWLPLAWLQGTPFSDYTIPGLALLVIIGGGMLLAAAAQFVRRAWAVLFSAAMGLVMIGFEVVEIAVINRYAEAVVPSTIVQQVLFIAIGLTIFALSASLCMAEYRHPHVPTSTFGTLD